MFTILDRSMVRREDLLKILKMPQAMAVMDFRDNFNKSNRKKYIYKS